MIINTYMKNNTSNNTSYRQVFSAGEVFRLAGYGPQGYTVDGAL